MGTPILDIEPPGRASAGLVAAARRLMERVDELTERSFEEIRKIPEYAERDDPVVWNDIRDVVPNNIRLYYATVIEGRTPRDDEMQAARFYARRRVEQGVSLRGVRSAYARGVRILWRALIAEVAGKPKLEKELLDRSAWAFQHLEYFNSAVAEAYYEAQEGRNRHRDQLTRDLFDEIVDGDPAVVSSIESRARLAGLDVDSEFHVLVVHEPGELSGAMAWEGPPPGSVAVACAEAARVPPERVVVAKRGAEIFLVVPWGEPALDLKALAETVAKTVSRLAQGGGPARVGVSGRVKGAGALRKAWHEAKRAIDLGAVLRPTDGIHFYEDYVLQDVLDSAPEQGQRLVAQTLSPLLELGEPGERLVETLAAYFRAGLNLKVTAGELAIHRNTLTYRLQRVRDLTGLDLVNPTTRLLLENAIEILLIQRMRQRAAGGDALAGD